MPKKAKPPREIAPIDHVPDPEDDGDSKFARALGSGDFHTRDKGVKALTLWLQRQHSLSDYALRKIWQGIFYCFWHSDKAHVQEELAQRLAVIFSQLDDQVAFGYFKGFMDTMQRQWPKIDRLRLDKFMMMVRKFLERLFTSMAEGGWDTDFVGRYMALLHDSAFEEDNALTTVGFGLHVADVFLSELLRASSTAKVAVPSQCTQLLLQPFVAVLSRTRQPALVGRIRQSVFEGLADELCKPSEGAPLAAVDAMALAESLLAAGERADVRHKNRAALYDLSQRFERVHMKRARDAEKAGAASDEPKAKRKKTARGDAQEPNAKQAEDARQSGQRAAKVSPNRAAAAAIDAGPRATAAQAAEEQVAATEGAGGKGRHVPKRAGGATAAPQSDPSRVDPVATTPETVGKKGKKRKAKVGGVLVLQSASAASDAPKAEAGSTNGMHVEAQVALRDRAAVKMRATATEAASVVVPQSAPPVRAAGSGEGVNGKSKKRRRASLATGGPVDGDAAEQAVLADAVRALSSAKKLHFDLKKNVVHQIGKPLPAAELRTPPRAKPNGSALKKVSSLPPMQRDSQIAKKLTFSNTKERPKALDFD